MDLVKQGVEIKRIYIDIFQMSQYELGQLWQSGKINVAQEHYCTAATQLIMSQLYPYIFKTKKGKHFFVGACINGEMHEIGIRMLADLLELDGWNTMYLGANVPDESIVKTLIDNKADVLGISATMTFHLGKVEKLIKTVRQSEIVGKIKIFVGGYVFNNNSELWRQVGADGFATDAEESLVKINSIVKLI